MFELQKIKHKETERSQKKTTPYLQKRKEKKRSDLSSEIMQARRKGVKYLKHRKKKAVNPEF